MHPRKLSQDFLRTGRVVVTGFMLLLGACYASTTVDQVWTTPVRAEPPMQRVVTIMISPNVTMRRASEDRLAIDLAKQGVQATPGYQVFQDGATDVQQLEPMKAHLKELGYDGVVTMRIVEREQQLETAPATFDGYWGYWGPGYWGGYSGGYVYTETIYRVESAAYSLRNGQLLWTALTKTVDPSSSHDLVKETTKIIASQLTERGLAG